MDTTLSYQLYYNLQYEFNFAKASTKYNHWFVSSSALMIENHEFYYTDTTFEV